MLNFKPSLADAIGVKLFAVILIILSPALALAIETVCPPPQRALEGVLREVRELGHTPRSTHVTQQVPGLYESIPLSEVIQVDGYRYQTEVGRGLFGSRVLVTNIFDSRRREVGSFFTTFEGQTGTLTLDTASLQLIPGQPAPSFVRLPGAVELVPGRGIPTQMFVRLQHLRMSGIEAGAAVLRRVETGGISNQRTLAELLQTPEIRTWLRTNTTDEGLRAGVKLSELQALVERHFGQTQTGRYIRDLLTQSGYCIGQDGFKILLQFNIERPNLRGVSRTQTPEVYQIIEQAIADGIQRIPSLGFSVGVDAVSCAR